MKASTSSIDRFTAYLRSARRRETFRRVLLFLSLTCLALLLVTALGAAAGLFRGFTPTLTNTARVALALVALLAFIGLLLRPLRVLNTDQGAALVENADAAFDGRVRTFVDTQASNPKQPFLSLLARDALSVARRVPLARIVPSSALIWPLFLLVLLIGGLFGFRQYAPPAWQNAALHVWWGWRDDTLVEPRTVAVAPGSIELLAGEDLDLEIELTGFRQESVELHARTIGDEHWQTTEITSSPDERFRFTLFRVNEPLEYYVTAAFSKSETFEVSVLQPARLERIDADFDYPEWTRLPAETRMNVGAISSVKNTGITLYFSLDRPLQDGTVRMGDTLLALEQLEQTEQASDQTSVRYRTSFVMDNDTQYQLLDRMLDREVPISAEHAVTVRGDEAPEVKFIKPGRDVTASPIEEVAISVEARDDFAIESIELLYSVNAGDWESVELPVDQQAEHVFFLESLGSRELPASEVPASEDGPSPARQLQGVAMQPGDLITYYVRVRDHDSMSETDMMLIDVRPFERRFSEEQGAAGGGGGGGGAANEGSEISRRQKEILLATWNLQRAREAAGGDVAGQEDNARLLSELQTTLADQARTLADRSEARDLVEQGEEIRQFVEYLREAADQMEPSATALEELAFSDAIQPQQKALQLLQRAEALFADIRMTQQQGQGGGGQQAGQDMAEMFELEMDLERNQYEQPDRGGNDAGSTEELDDIFDELAELARRQQALAEAQQQREQLTREEQWEQQQLSRELEELQRNLEQLQRDAANAEGAEAEALEQAASELSEQLQRAREALDESQQQAGSADQQPRGEQQNAEGQNEESQGAEQQESLASGDPQDSDEQSADARNSEDPNGARAASEALQQALSALGEARSRLLQEGIENALAISNELLEQQRDVEEQLRAGVERAIRSRENGTFAPGLTPEKMLELATRKRELRRDLEAVRDDVEDLQQRFGDEAPETGEALEQAIKRLDESRAAEMLGIAGDSISNGSVATVLPGESLVTNALREWRDRLSEANETAADEQLQSQDNTDIQVADALDQLQDLREQLSGGNRQDQLGGEGQQGEGQQGEGQQGEGQQGEGQQGEGQQGEGQQGEGQQGEGQQGEGQQGEGQQGEGQQGEGQQGEGQQGEGQQGEGQQGEGQQGEGQQGEGQQGQGQQGQGQQGQGQQGQGQQGQGQQGQGQQGQGQQGGSQLGGRQGQTGDGGISQGSGSRGGETRGDGAQRGFVREADPQRAGQTADALDSLVPRLDALGVSEADLEALQESADLLRRGGGDINAARVEAEYRQILRQIEKLEIQISNAASSTAAGTEPLVRQGEVSDSAADYYRRLSEQPLRLQR